jgi:hypothetical protein
MFTRVANLLDGNIDFTDGAVFSRFPLGPLMKIRGYLQNRNRSDPAFAQFDVLDRCTTTKKMQHDI